MPDRHTDLRICIALGTALLLLILALQSVSSSLHRQNLELRGAIDGLQQRVENLEAGYSSAGMTLREQVSENARLLRENSKRLDVLMRNGRR